jgi:hypothetical protein
MAEPLVTGSPQGSILAQEEIYIEGAPYLYFQDANATPLNNPDGQGFYWNLSGTTAYPVYRIGCIQDVSLTEGLTINQIRCDTVGDKASVQRRDYIEFAFKFTSLLPLTALRHMLNLGSAPTVAAGYEKVGIGSINNNQFYHFYAPKVYDDTAADYVAFHLHRAQFIDAWTINMKAGEGWAVEGIKVRAFADETKNSTAKFGTIVRFDSSALP